MTKTYGMLLITGPTGSGKTTTLYTILQQLNRPEVNICTIEDPIEYELHNINQTQINPKVDLTFANGLRAFLRQDPNIIMVGEIRDFETADIAVQAALTGHLLLSTLHTNDAPSSIPRILDLGVPGYLLAATLNLILAQRLTRKICLDCIFSEPTTAIQKEMMVQQLKNSGLPDKEISKIKLPDYLYKGKGCQICNLSGYRGRTGIFEAIEIDEDLRNYLSQKIFNLQEFRIFIREKKGFRTMFEDGLEKLNMGVTTLEEVLRVIKE
jgi:type II secretory ATPase GspE/PulE/Tfp pilus assembly ATPase PilB-like protein